MTLWSARWRVRSMWDEIFSIPGRIIAFFFAVGLVLLPFLTSDLYLQRIVILSCIFSMLAASWDLLAGYAGQISLGHALFFGVGAYGAALLNVHFGLPAFCSVPLGALGAWATGLLVGLPCLRLRGPHLALATLAFPLLLTGLVLSFPRWTGGELGLFRVARLTQARFYDYYAVVGATIFALLALWALTRSRLGLVLQAIREDEVATRAVGINTTLYKLLAFSISGLVAGVAGGLHAHFLRTAGPGNLSLLRSFEPVIWTMFGGMGTIYGPVVGVFVLYPAVEFFRGFSEYQTLAFAVVVLFILRFLPQGLAQWARDKLELDCPHCRAKNAFFRRRCRACEKPLVPQGAHQRGTA